MTLRYMKQVEHSSYFQFDYIFILQAFCEKAADVKKSNRRQLEPKALGNEEFVAVEGTLQIVPFEETSLVIRDMQTVIVTIIILGK